MITPPNASPIFRSVRWLALLLITLLIASWLISAPLFVYGIFNDLDSILYQIHTDSWSPESVRMAAEGLGFGPQAPAWAWFIQEVMLVTTFVPMGLLLFLRKPDPMGTYLGVVMILTGTYIAGPVAFTLAKIIPFAGKLTPVMALLAFLGFASIIYVFPNGRFVPRWTRFFMPAMFVLLSIYSVIAETTDHPKSNAGDGLEAVLFLSYLGVGVLAQTYRYFRVSTPTEKRQTRLILLSFAFFLAIIIFAYVAAPNTIVQLEPPQPIELLIFTIMYYVLTIVIIIFMVGGLAISILRHRLYDLDLVIRRTLTYGIVTAILALTYFGGVTLMQSLVIRLTGQNESPLVLVITTLTIAALFNPLRTRIQTIVDRRFHRRGYDIQHTLDAFNDQMRDQVDVAHIQSAMLTIIQQTIEPEHITLWLTEREESQS